MSRQLVCGFCKKVLAEDFELASDEELLGRHECKGRGLSKKMRTAAREYLKWNAREHELVLKGGRG